jgi:hypothetical protein
MIELENIKTKEIQLVSSNVAHGLIETGEWKKAKVKYSNKQLKNYSNKSYGSGDTHKRKNIYRNKRKRKG